MWYVLIYALGVFTGVYIVDVQLRLKVNTFVRNVGLFMCGVVERRKKVKLLEAELKQLREHTQSSSIKFK